MVPSMDEVTEQFVVVYFAADGDHRKPRPDFQSALRFANRDGIREWNPIIEKVTTTVRREFVWNSMDSEPTGPSFDV